MDIKDHIKLCAEVQELRPITLGYAFHKPGVVEETNTEPIPLIKADSKAFLDALNEKHSSRIAAVNKFLDDRKQRAEEELRHKAPGFNAGPLQPSSRSK